jgi:protein transport protein SEC61 subunit alpha
MSASQPVVDALVPLAAWIPDIVKPDPRRPPRLAEKVLHTVVALFLFLVCSQLPLWGVKRLQGADPFLYARQIMASSRGTLMELGIGPVVTAGMLMQLLRGSRLLLFDFSIPRDRAEHKGLTNLLALTITLGQALAYVLSGMYGSVFDLGALKALAIVAQLVCAGLVVVVLDEVLTDYGVASGISLFTCTNICESVVWKALSPHTVQRDTGTQFEGAAVAAVAGVLTERDPVRALKNAFYRAHAPNLQSLLATAVVVAAVVFLQGLRQELPVEERTKSAGVTGGSRQDPLKIRLFYTSTMPIILQSALVSNLYFLSQLLWSRFGASGGAAASVLAVFGRWEQSARGGFRPPARERLSGSPSTPWPTRPS